MSFKTDLINSPVLKSPAGQHARLHPSGCQPVLFVVLGLMAAGYATPARADSPESVQKIAGPAGHTVWQILRPRVNQPITDYPQITFTKNSIVTVTATGCVQTGGGGGTWKRYVDPVGDNTNKLYHGQISIPGATNGLEWYMPTQPTVYTIPSSINLPASQMHLKLGYLDDGYNDNGYYSHDDGNLNQCWNVGDASVKIDIAEAPAVVPPPAHQDYNFTLDSIVIRELRSPKSDTDVLGSAVTVDGTQSVIAKKSVGDLKQGSHSLSFPILIQQVTPDNRVDIAYTIVNSGAGNAQQTDSAIAGVIGKVGGSIPVVGQYMSVAAAVWQEIFNLADPNCDGVVVAGSVMGTGTDLARWTQDGSYTRTLSFPGTDSATGCGANSFYELTYSITRNLNTNPKAFNLVVNAPNLTHHTPNASSINSVSGPVSLMSAEASARR